MKRTNYTVIFLLSLVFLFYLTTVCPAETDRSFKGKIVFLSGNVLVNNVKVKVGDFIVGECKIITGKKSSCEVIFKEKNIIHIGENSNADLNITEKLKKIKLNSGFLINILKNLEKLANSMLKSYTVETSTAVAGVRGTSFFVKVEDPNNTYICDCNGIVEVQNIKGSEKQTVKASHHQAVRLTKTDKDILVKPAPMLYHTDKDLEDLASKIDVHIDWTKIDDSSK